MSTGFSSRVVPLPMSLNDAANPKCGSRNVGEFVAIIDGLVVQRHKEEVMRTSSWEPNNLITRGTKVNP